MSVKRGLEITNLLTIGLGLGFFLGVLGASPDNKGLLIAIAGLSSFTIVLIGLWRLFTDRETETLLEEDRTLNRRAHLYSWINQSATEKDPQ